MKMASFNINLLEMDVDKLFEERTISEIMEIEKLLDAEIERKRVELRGMVGDRYKDVLTASDAIKSMKCISEGIVDNIQRITDHCEALTTATVQPKKQSDVQTPQKIQERSIIMQIRLALTLTNQIWMALEEEDFLKATQIYLLAQHVHTGLQLLNADVLKRLPILKRMKSDIDSLRSRILKRTKEKLKSLELSVEETSSNLNALMLLEQYRNNMDLLNMFIDIRKAALSVVINEQHYNVRAQVTAMYKCLVATVHLLYECFVDFQKTGDGLIWQQLNHIVGKDSPSVLSKITLPPTPLVFYIPDIIKQFRPKCDCSKAEKANLSSVTQNWLRDTLKIVQEGLRGPLELISNIKGLHIIREETLKIDLPPDWESICNALSIDSFNPWLYFFQTLITNRVKSLVSKKTSEVLLDLQNNIRFATQEAVKAELSEADLRWYIWKEEEGDVSRVENKHAGLSMKTRGYSPVIVRLCTNLDKKYLELLEDLSLYLHGNNELGDQVQNVQYLKPVNISSRNHVDKNEIESYLRVECVNNIYKLTSFLEEIVEEDTIKSLLCARFLQAINELCPNLCKCCSLNSQTREWESICSHFSKFSLQFYGHWLKSCGKKIEEAVKDLYNIEIQNMLIILPKWENLEIQEQTEDKVFKSQIKIPSQPSVCLQRVLSVMNNQMSAVIPHTLPKKIHLWYIETSMQRILEQYELLSNKDINQIQALQFLFDVKFVTTLCIPRENIHLISKSQSVCDTFRSKIDPFDLDVFYSYLQTNVKVCVLQSQVILGCLLPSATHLASLGMFEKSKDLEKEPSVLATSIPSTASWFPLLPVTAPIQKVAQPIQISRSDPRSNNVKLPEATKKPSVSSVKSGAAAFFGAMTNDWFS